MGIPFGLDSFNKKYEKQSKYTDNWSCVSNHIVC